MLLVAAPHRLHDGVQPEVGRRNHRRADLGHRGAGEPYAGRRLCSALFDRRRHEGADVRGRRAGAIVVRRHADDHFTAPRPPQPIGPLPETFGGDSWTHDPSLIRTADGSYLAYATHNLIEVRRSSDGRNFRYVGSAFAAPIAWGEAYGTTMDLWAPDVSFHDGRYWMYYAISSFGSQHSAIGLATSLTGAAGSWQDKGKVYASNEGDDFNAIDPNLVVDARGQWWLTFGSFWSGIKLIRLDPATGMPSPHTKRYSLATRLAAPGAIEAPFIREKGGWFYLYVSFDFCCRGAESTYRIMVGRSHQITGPYLDKSGAPMLRGGGTQLLASAGHEHGPGGESVVPTSQGDRLVFHFYADNGTPTLGTRLLRYASGWPVVARAG